ncbi:hypothetical protein DLM85_03615 [Hymenobacter edaphi]|uniref:Uncharacterized protein n=1 Tax=Hymenobacter edaphi TaxID=2211146 RepID=A0A328BSD1_9BACT|nr:hypothetical protein DLM85_03615 [Hymenobacter edaphi]
MLLAAAFLPACDALLGQEVARLPINALSAPGKDQPQEVTVALKKGETVAVWSEMDMRYKGEQRLEFQLTVLQNGQPFQQLAFDPRDKNLSLKEIKADNNGDVSWSFTGKNTELTIPADGRYTFRGRLLAAPAHGPDIRKAELVLRR